MDIKYNEILGAFVNTANDEKVTQAELLEWAAENPMPLDEPKKQDPKMLNELIESLTVKQTPDSTSVEEGVEIITEKVQNSHMAEIDKSLPNTKTEIEIPGEDVIVEEQQAIVERQQAGEPEIEMNDDGGATINFDPSAVNHF